MARGKGSIKVSLDPMITEHASDDRADMSPPETRTTVDRYQLEDEQDAGRSGKLH